MAVTSAILVSLSAATSIYQAQKEEEFREEQLAIQESQRAEQRFRQRRRAIRQQRIRQGQIQQAAQNTGVAGSSGELGAVSSLSTNFASNMGFLSGEAERSEQARASSARFASATTRSGIAQSIFSAGLSVASAPQVPDVAGASSDIDDIFADDSLF